MKAFGVLIAIALALALQTTLARFLVGGTAAVDLVLVVVVYVALTSGPVTGMLAGSLAGIVIGVGGLANSIVGFLAGVIGQQFIVTAALPRLLIFLAATVVHAAVFMGFYMLLGLRSFSSPWAAVTSQALGNAAVGLIAFAIVESLPGAVERRRMGRRTKL